MTIKSKTRAGLFSALTALATLLPAAVQAADRGPVVVELFTSQGCYSCPPAEAFLGELSQRTDVVALEFHVDYWDDLVYGFAGKWKDPFSDAAHTQRQYAYNRAIKRKNSVYTPQMVIDGRVDAVGSRREQVQRAITRSRVVGDRLDVRVDVAADRSLKISIDGKAEGAPDAQGAQGAAVWLVELVPSVTTQVRSGENKGKTLISHNIVTGVSQIGEWRGRATRFSVTPGTLAKGRGCAIIVQTAHPGPILGAANCPPAAGS